MQNNSATDDNLFLSVLGTLEALQVPYFIVGAFAGTLMGVTRITFDLDLVVSLSEYQIDALAERYPLPDYYADPQQMRESMRLGILFNILDSRRGEKVDLLPLQPSDQRAMARRIRQQGRVIAGVADPESNRGER